MLWRKFTPRAISYRIRSRSGQASPGYMSFYGQGGQTHWSIMCRFGQRFGQDMLRQSLSRALSVRIPTILGQVEIS